MSTIVHTSAGNVRVYGEARINSLELPTEQHMNSIYIPEVVVPVDEMSASKFGVMAVLRGKNFFNSKQHPNVVVTGVNIFSNNLVKGTIHIKDHFKMVLGTWVPAPGNRIKIDFNIHLSEFEIARKVLFFTIDDLAKVEVEMDNPF